MWHVGGPYYEGPHIAEQSIFLEVYTLTVTEPVKEKDPGHTNNDSQSSG